MFGKKFKRVGRTRLHWHHGYCGRFVPVVRGNWWTEYCCYSLRRQGRGWMGCDLFCDVGGDIATWCRNSSTAAESNLSMRQINVNFLRYTLFSKLSRPNSCKWDNRFMLPTKMLYSCCGVALRFIFTPLQLMYMDLWLSLRVKCTSSYAIACRRFRRCYFL